MEMAKGRRTKTIVLGVVFIAASWFFSYMCHRFGGLGDIIFTASKDNLYLFIWLLVAVVLVAITAGLVAVLIRPLRITVAIFALASLTLLCSLGWDILGLVLALMYLLTGVLYTRGVVKGLEERIKFSLRPVYSNQVSLLIILAIIISASFYGGYAAQVEKEGIRIPSFLTDAVVGVAEDQLKGGIGVSLEEEGRSELREDFEQQTTEWLEPFRRYITIGVAVVMFSPLVTILTILSWIPLLVLKGLLRLLISRHVIEAVGEMREVERLSMG